VDQIVQGRESRVRWQGQRQSENIEDRRGLGPASIGGVGGLGIGGIVLVLAVSYFTGVNPLTLIDMMSGLQSTTEAPIDTVPTGPVKDEIGRFASVVLADTEDTWQQLLPKTGRQYENPRLVLFTGAVHSACGATSSAVGPFYCPQDRKLYLDLSFFKDMSERFGAPGDFAQAYVIAHEVGHHVQNLLGIAENIQRLERQAGEAQGNALSVRMELQADCLAGVWGRSARSALDITDEDLGEALTAAHAIGDDTLGHSDERQFTHGSSEQRKRWFRRGFESGDARQCDTFAVRNYREL